MRRRISRTVVTLAALGLFAPAWALAQSAPAEQPEEPPFRWRNRPSLQFGALRVDLRLKLAHDWRGFEPDFGEDETLWRVRRGGIDGEIGRHFEFQVERDLISDGRWRDVYVNWRTFRQVQVQFGRFKVPFGREELTSITALDFASRALVSSVIPPARASGLMVHGRFLQRGVTYEVGVFGDDGDNGELREEQFSLTGHTASIGRSFAARATATPFRALSKRLDELRVGAAYGATDVPEGLNSLRGPTVYGTTEFFEPVYVNGMRQRVGLELSFTPGPVGFTGEWMQAREQRQGQGLGEVDLSDLVTTGWLMAATWLITGEDKAEFDEPRRPVFESGFGALEAAVRVERLGFASAQRVGPAFRNPRATHILGNRDLAWTFGVNWFPNRWVRLTVNAVREDVQDAARTPITGTNAFWSGVTRLQVVF